MAEKKDWGPPLPPWHWIQRRTWTCYVANWTLEYDMVWYTESVALVLVW